MRPDYDKYRPLLDAFNLAEAQKDDFIDVMWSLLASFVERAHGVDPVQKIEGKEAQDSGAGDQLEVKYIYKTIRKDLSHE
ncbi:MAG: hypothetical protein ACFB2Z_11570 [Maricaulaceae bacterium]